jgi:hypothetical protein
MFSALNNYFAGIRPPLNSVVSFIKLEILSMSIIECIRTAIQQGYLTQPFNAQDVCNALQELSGCSYPLKTIQNFLPKHRNGNPSNTSALFERISTYPVQYRIV